MITERARHYFTVMTVLKFCYLNKLYNDKTSGASNKQTCKSFFLILSYFVCFFVFYIVDPKLINGSSIVCYLFSLE